TVGYDRRVVNLQTQTNGGQLAGVSISDIQRVADQFLDAETLSAGSSSARYDTQNTIFSQLSGLLGKPGDNSSLTAQLTNLAAALGQPAPAPTASASQLGVLNGLQSLAGTLSGLASSVSNLRDQVDQQVSSAISGINALIKQIYDLNAQVKNAQLAGDTASG